MLVASPESALNEPVGGVTHAPAASQYCVVVPPVGQVTTCELALLLEVQGVPPFSVIDAAGIVLLVGYAVPVGLPL